MNKIKVLLLYIVYPLAMGTYFKRALERNPDVDLKVVGPYTGSWIPWTDAQHPGGMSLPEKYAIPPDLPLDLPPNIGRVNYEYIAAQLDGWKPDLVMCVDAGINWVSKPHEGYVVTVGTDPHVLNYSHARSISDKFFCMQKCYSEPGDIYLPYAYDPSAHFSTGTEKDIDAVIVGNTYQDRLTWVGELRKHGVSVEHQLGIVFDEARALYNRGRIGLNWSTLNDLNARFFEIPAFGLPMVANRVPDAHLFLTEDEDYVAFSTLPEAVEKVLYLKNNSGERERIAVNGFKKIQGQTYDARIDQILTESRI